MCTVQGAGPRFADTGKDNNTAMCALQRQNGRGISVDCSKKKWCRRLETERIKKVFPAYFKNFILPDCAKEQEILVYRACPTRKIEKASFLNTYEENGFRIEVGSGEDDPQQYCLSTNTRAKDLKRFVALNGKFSPPFLLAKGVTNPECGVSCQSSEWLHKKTNHVDWWLYTDAEPWKYFEAVDYENEK